METYQFSLFFAALLVAYVLVHVRLVRFETYLKEIAGIKSLNDRLKRVSDVLERVRLDRVEEQLDQLHADMAQLLEAADRVERAIRVAAPPAGAAPAPAAFAAGERIRAAVETRLLSLGYSDLKLLTDLSKASLDDDLEVLVECQKDHVTCKGKVTTRNGAIREVQMQPVTQTFP